MGEDKATYKMDAKEHLRVERTRALFMMTAGAIVVVKVLWLAYMMLGLQAQEASLHAIPDFELLSASPLELQHVSEDERVIFKGLFDQTPEALFGSPPPNLPNVTDFIPTKQNKAPPTPTPTPTPTPSPPSRRVEAPTGEEPWVRESKLPPRPAEPTSASRHEDAAQGYWGHRVIDIR